MLKKAIAFTDDQPVLFAGIVAGLILGTAFASQIFGGLAPCELCWWQRYPYMAIIGVSLVGTFVKAIPQKLLLLLLAALFLTDAGLALFHVGVEQHWWEGLPTCSSTIDFTDNIKDALDAIMNTAVVRCDEVAWSLFGVSMAGYNMLAALVMSSFLAAKFKKA